MTGALAVYSAVFARYAMAVTPKNYLLFGCHVINFSSQVTQGYRFMNYWKYVPDYISLKINAPLELSGCGYCADCAAHVACALLAKIKFC